MHQSWLLGALSSHIPKFSKDRDCAAFPGNLHQHVTGPMVRFSLYPVRTSLISIYAPCLSSSHHTLLQRSCFHLLDNSFVGAAAALRSLIKSSLLQAEQAQLLLSQLTVQVLQPPDLLSGPPLNCLHFTDVLLVLATPNCREYSRWGLTNAKSRDIMTPNDSYLLAVLLLIQPGLLFVLPLLPVHAAGSCSVCCSPSPQQSCPPAAPSPACVTARGS